MEEEVKKRISQIMFLGFFLSAIIGVLVTYQIYGIAAILFCSFIFYILVLLLGIVTYKE